MGTDNDMESCDRYDARIIKVRKGSGLESVLAWANRQDIITQIYLDYENLRKDIDKNGRELTIGTVKFVVVNNPKYLAQEYIDKIPIIRIPETDNCPICKDSMNDGDEVRQLPCGHFLCLVCFGPKCVKCPVCRFELKT